jgi:hypothetical protein
VNTNCLDIIRTAIEGLSDEQVHLIIESVVGGFVGGMIDDIHARKDDIVAEVVTNIVGHIAAAAQQAQLRDVAVTAAKIGAPSSNIDAALADLQGAHVGQSKAASSTAQDAVRHTCEACGREGTRRYTKTETGWRCAPSSAKKCARQAAHRPVAIVDPRFTHRGSRDLAGTGGIQAGVTSTVPAAATVAVRARGAFGAPGAEQRSKETTVAAKRSQDAGAVATARCQDCHRGWTLTGTDLRRAVEAHELEKGHIVDVFDDVEGGAA